MNSDILIIINQILLVLKPFESIFVQFLGSILVVALGFLMIKYICITTISYFKDIAEGAKKNSSRFEVGSYDYFYWSTRENNDGISLFPNPVEHAEMVAQGKVYNTNTGEWEDRI